MQNNSARSKLILSMRAGATPMSGIPSSDIAAGNMWRRTYQRSREAAHKSGFQNAQQYLMHGASLQAQPGQSPLDYLSNMASRLPVYPPAVFYG